MTGFASGLCISNFRISSTGTWMGSKIGVWCRFCVLFGRNLELKGNDGVERFGEV